MDRRILESIIALTEKQDIDSLELSLLSSIAELLDCKQATIYEVDVLDDSRIATALSVMKEGQTGDYRWVNNVPSEEITPELQKAMDKNMKTRIEDPDGRLNLWLPIAGGSKQVCLHIECHHLTSQQHYFVEAIVKIYSNYLSILVESERDKLTGLLNRHSFDRRLQQILKRQRQKLDMNLKDPGKTRRHPVDKLAWLVMLDIDHFKEVNDRFGHVCGDEVLLTLTQKMQSYFRQSDVMFRFGGEEFVLILGPSQQQDAFDKLNDFRKTVENAVFPLTGHLTISIGFTAITEEFQQLLIERADKALYYGKKHGRNQVRCYEELLRDKCVDDSQRKVKQEIELF